MARAAIRSDLVWTSHAKADPPMYTGGAMNHGTKPGALQLSAEPARGCLFNVISASSGATRARTRVAGDALGAEAAAPCKRPFCSSCAAVTEETCRTWTKPQSLF